MAAMNPVNPEAVPRKAPRSGDRSLMALGWGSGILLAVLLGMLALGGGPGPWTMGVGSGALGLKGLQLLLWHRRRKKGLRRSPRSVERGPPPPPPKKG